MKTMNTILKTTLVLVLALAVKVTLAGGNLSLNLLPVSGEKAVLDISSFTGETVSIKITDEAENIVYYSEGVEATDKIRKVCDFSNLEDGNYTLTVLSDGLSVERQFRKDIRSIEVGEEATVLPPTFSVKDDLLRCSYLNFAKKDVRLELYAGNDVIYSKKIGNHFSMTEGVSLRKLEQGNYTVCLTDGIREFTYNIEK